MAEKFNFHNFTDLLERAGINGAEAAPLFMVKRTSIYNWMSGKGPHQEVLKRFAERQVLVIERAITAGDLPMRDIPKHERKKILTTIIKKHLAA